MHDVDVGFDADVDDLVAAFDESVGVADQQCRRRQVDDRGVPCAGRAAQSERRVNEQVVAVFGDSCALRCRIAFATSSRSAVLCMAAAVRSAWFR